MAINYNRLREDLEAEGYGAFFGGGIGPAILEAFEAEDASDEELLELAKEKGFNLEDYEY